jgi:RNA polymerase sigma-70 factor (ECF subfamily)
VAWLEPYPDGELDVIADEAPGPEARYEARQAVRLAFVAVIQRLPPRQRAVLLLCDVMGWSSAETAALLGGSTASVNSALQRARATLVRLHPEGRSAEEPDAGQRQLLERYLQAWEAFDLDGFAALLRDDVVYTMPPLPQWYAGRAAVRTFFAMVWPLYRGFRLIATAANGQPAFAGYSRNASGSGWSPHSIHVLTLKKGEISRLTLFVKPDAPALFAPFGLPAALDQ